MPEIEMGEHIGDKRPGTHQKQAQRRRHLQITQKNPAVGIEQHQQHHGQPDEYKNAGVYVNQLRQHAAAPERLLKISKNTFHCPHLSSSSI